MAYPTGPAPTRQIVKQDLKGHYAVVINRGGYGAYILNKLLKKRG